MKIYSYISIFALLAYSLPLLANDEKPTLPQFSGVIEIEAGFSDGESDLNLATFELGIDHVLSDKVEGHVLFLYEGGENNDNIAVDEATITLRPSKQTAITLGRMVVPFGQFDSNLLSDPLTLELGETGEDVIQVSQSFGRISSAFYLFNDDKDDSKKIDDFGLNLSYESDAFSTGVSYISDVNDQSTAKDSAKGIAVHAKASLARATLIAEHVTIKGVKGKKPNASHLELGIDLGAERTLAFSVDKTKDAAPLELPEKSFAIAYSMPVYDKIGLGAEVMKTEGYNGKKDTLTTLKLSYEF